MRWVDCRNKKLCVQTPRERVRLGSDWVGWEELVSTGLAWQSVHELLFDSAEGHPSPAFPALTLAREIMGLARSPTDPAGQLPTSRKLIWCDPGATLYPPAIIAAGIPQGRLCIVRPPFAAVIWTVAECLRCEGVSVVVAELPAGLSRPEARRLQLAAEHGGGIGLMLRQRTRRDRADIYAAATRWLVSSAPGDRVTQRWTIQLIHGHGGRLGQSFTLEARRVLASATAVVHPVPLPAAVAHLPTNTPASLASA